MELRHLRSFVTLAEELSFSAAARRLHMAQPPLSVQIKQLEQRLGAQLLERTSRRVRLTPAGELLLEHARAILHDSNVAVREIQRASRGEVGRLRLSYSGTPLNYNLLLPEILRGYRAAHREVNLILHEQVVTQQAEEILTGRIEAGFLGLAHSDTQAAGREELATECLVQEPYFAVLPEGHLLTRRQHIGRAAIAAQPLVYTARLAVYLREGGCELGHGQANLEVNSVATIFNYVAAGFGVSVLPRQFTSVPVPGVCFVPCLTGLSYRYGVAWRRGGERAEPLASFLAHAREVGRHRGDAK